MRTTLGRGLGILIVGLWSGCGAADQPRRTPDEARQLEALELKVKAGFLYNFARFTTWPTNAFASTDAPVVLGVVCDETFGAALEELLRGKTVEQRPLQIRRLEQLEQIDGCQIVYIGKCERLAPVLAPLNNRSVLTVSDQYGFARAGGMIGLLRAGDRRKFEINLRAVERADLRLDPRLLKLADIVDANRATGQEPQ